MVHCLNKTFQVSSPNSSDWSWTQGPEDPFQKQIFEGETEVLPKDKGTLFWHKNGGLSLGV